MSEDLMSEDLMSEDVLSWDVLSLGTFCLRTFCLCTLGMMVPCEPHYVQYSLNLLRLDSVTERRLGMVVHWEPLSVPNEPACTL